MKPTMTHEPQPMASILEALSQTLDRLREPNGERQRTALVAETICHLGAVLQAPTLDTAAEPYYDAVDDYRGDPFEPGVRIPYRRGSALYRACAIFAGCSNPITRRRFIELGGVERDLDRLVDAGRVVRVDP